MQIYCIFDSICFMFNHCLKSCSIKTKHCTDSGIMEIMKFASSKVSVLAGYLRIFVNVLLLHCKSWFSSQQTLVFKDLLFIHEIMKCYVEQHL